MGHIILDGIKWSIVVFFRIFAPRYNISLAPARWPSSWKVTSKQWLTGEIKLDLLTNKYQKRILRCLISPKCQWAEINFKVIINNYSPKWRWIVVDIYRAAKRRGKYPPLSPTLRWIIVLVYTTQAEYLAPKKQLYLWKYTVKSRFVFLRLLGGELYLANHLRASQSARAKSTIHLCGIY